MSAKTSLSRRRFLQVSMTAASAGVLPAGAAFAVPPAGRAIRVGLIGMGRRGQVLAKRLRGFPDVALVAVADSAEPHNRIASAMGEVRVTRRWEDVVHATDIDAVVVAAPDGLHAPMTLAAMEAGKDVYCERPMALTLADARAVRHTARHTGRVVQIGTETVSEGQWSTARRLVEDGIVGQVLWCQGRLAPMAGTEPTWEARWTHSLGAPLTRHHDQLAALISAVGPACPERVSAAGGVFSKQRRDTPDACIMSAEYAAGHTIVLTASAVSQPELPAVIRGQAATLYMEGRHVRVTAEPGHEERLKRRFGTTGEVLVPSAPDRDLVRDWVDCIRTRTECIGNCDLGYQAAVGVTLAAEAYRSRRTVGYDAGRECMTVGAPRVTV